MQMDGLRGKKSGIPGQDAIFYVIFICLIFIKHVGA